MTKSLRDVLREKIVVIDGAMGTAVQAADLELERDFLGKENCCEVVNLTRPEVIRGIHESFLAARTNVAGWLKLSDIGYSLKRNAVLDI